MGLCGSGVRLHLEKVSHQVREVKVQVMAQAEGFQLEDRHWESS